MPSSSSSPRWIYDLFISFRGEETRTNFVSHHAALSNAGINTFLDKGGKLKPELERAIEGSHISIVVFSKSYTESSWCLDELVQIIECRRTYGQVVIPLFYDVDPAVVRHQKGAFGKALATTARNSYIDKGMRVEDLLSKWRSALINAANLSGWDADKFRDEAVLVKQIVEDVLKRAVEPSPGEEVQPSPNVKMGPSLVKKEPLPKSNKKILTRLAMRVGECLCLNLNRGSNKF